MKKDTGQAGMQGSRPASDIRQSNASTPDDPHLHSAFDLKIAAVFYPHKNVNYPK
ncbi:hypothetical protein [Ralstonia chuxiongensis]|uniref:hypothetical protein n=1 Tax=Ralstonia chuxiongensis TaxID=2957504 RepID=UPI0029316A82|nr:hypothetical protein [Ralstonia chuxiongensis]